MLSSTAANGVIRSEHCASVVEVLRREASLGGRQNKNVTSMQNRHVRQHVDEFRCALLVNVNFKRELMTFKTYLRLLYGARSFTTPRKKVSLSLRS